MYNTMEKQMESITDLRKQFDTIDREILKLLGKRSKLSAQMAREKKEKNLLIIQLKQWKASMKKRYEENERTKVDPIFLNRIFNLIHDESIRIQQEETKKMK